MDGQAILESLDTLWFFSSIFTSAPPSPSPSLSFSSCGDGNTDQPHLKDPPRTEEPKPHLKDPSRTEEPKPHLKDPPGTEEPKPRSPTLLKQPIPSPSTEILVETSSKSEDFSANAEMQVMECHIVDALESSSESPWKRRKPRKEKTCCYPSWKRRTNHRREEVSELGFSHSEVGFGGRPVLFLSEHQRMENTCGLQKLENLYQMKMPPLSDGTAMKEHIKSWAYAVACTVK